MWGISGVGERFVVRRCACVEETAISDHSTGSCTSTLHNVRLSLETTLSTVEGNSRPEIVTLRDVPCCEFKAYHICSGGFLALCSYDGTAAPH